MSGINIPLTQYEKFAKSIKVGDIVTHNTDFYQHDIYVSVIEMISDKWVDTTNIFHFDKDSKTWNKGSMAVTSLPYDHFIEKYRKLTEEEIEEIELSLIANKYNL